jgi:fucose 4-O-acetylase-like acetyltransferase
MNNSRIKCIDIARGIAIICIILGHLDVWAIVRIVFTFHVPIFFIITGYFTNTNNTIKSFIKKKFQTLIIPYIITCILTVVLAVIFNIALYDSYNTRQVVKDWVYASLYGAGTYHYEPFFIKQIGAIWFLWATFWASIFLRLILKLKPSYRIIPVILLFAIGYLTKSVWLPLSIQPGCCAVLFMYIGYLVNDAKVCLKSLASEIKITFTVLALCVWLYFIKDFQSFGFVICDFGRGVVDIFGCLCGCYIVTLVSFGIEKCSRLLTNILSFLGKYSIFMLCAHILELNLFPWYLITDSFAAHGISSNISLYVIIICKFIWAISFTVICSKSNLIRRVSGMSLIQKKTI